MYCAGTKTLFAQIPREHFEVTYKRSIGGVQQRPQLDFGLFHLNLHEKGVPTMEQECNAEQIDQRRPLVACEVVQILGICGDSA